MLSVFDSLLQEGAVRGVRLAVELVGGHVVEHRVQHLPDVVAQTQSAVPQDVPVARQVLRVICRRNNETVKNTGTCCMNWRGYEYCEFCHPK